MAGQVSRDVFSLRHGEIAFQWPAEGLAMDEYEDLQCFAQIWLRKMRRQVRGEGPKPDGPAAGRPHEEAK